MSTNDVLLLDKYIDFSETFFATKKRHPKYRNIYKEHFGENALDVAISVTTSGTRLDQLDGVLTCINTIVKNIKWREGMIFYSTQHSLFNNGCNEDTLKALTRSLIMSCCAYRSPLRSKRGYSSLLIGFELTCIHFHDIHMKPIDIDFQYINKESISDDLLVNPVASLHY